MMHKSIVLVSLLGSALRVGCSQSDEVRGNRANAAAPSVPASIQAPTSPAASPLARQAGADPARGSSQSEEEEEQPAPREKFEGGEKSFSAVRSAMLKKYYREGLTEDDLYRAAVRGMLEYADPAMHKWNKLLTPTALADLHVDLKGEIVGVGVAIKFEKETGHSDVVGVIPNSPAEKAGLLAGDKIVSVNGKLYKGMTIRDVVDDIRGKVGESVSLTVLRGAGLLTFTPAREVVTYDPVEQMDLPDALFYVHVRSFTSKTPVLLRAALEQGKSRGVRGVVIDVRENQGGSFDDAVASAELLVPHGAGIAALEKRGEKASAIVSKGEPLVNAGAPMVVLVDHATSSGAELLAGALQESAHATVVGQRTFGKWSVQNVEELSNGYGVKYTVATFATPSGRSFANTGLPPDVEVDMSEDQVGKAQTVLDPKARLEQDVQLRTGVALLRGR
jgi:carboxyl-terminal processing protease